MTTEEDITMMIEDIEGGVQDSTTGITIKIPRVIIIMGGETAGFLVKMIVAEDMEEDIKIPRVIIITGGGTAGLLVKVTVAEEDMKEDVQDLMVPVEVEIKPGILITMNID